MSYKDEIKELLKKLAERMQDPDLEWLDTNYSLKDNIDQNFSLEDAAGNVLEYWNESVKKLLEKLKDELDNPWGTGENINKNVSKEHDAAFDFNKQYVSPNPNLNSEKYEDNRTDEIISVLQNKKNLDYTIGEISSELKKYVTRLIMPQYQRRVEIEDLNRNFWVIGQNLSLLNKFILDLDGPILGAIKDLISEITGLWDNVYRIWQAILHLSKKTDDLNDDINDLASVAAKTRVKLSYGQPFGQTHSPFNEEEILKRLYKYNDDGTPSLIENKLQLTDYITFKKGDIKYFGLIPSIEKEEIKYLDRDGVAQTGYLAYLSYNKEIGINDLDSVPEKELEKRFLDTGTEAGLIQIERKFGNRTVKDILKDVRTENFVLLAPLLKGEVKVIDELTITTDPYLTFLQFLRDILFYTVEEIVEELTTPTVGQTVSLASLRLAYLNWLIFTRETRWLQADDIPSSFINAYKYIKKTKPQLIENTIFSNVETIGTIETFLNTLLNTNSASKLVEDFYKIYKNIAIEVGVQIEDITENNFPYFIENKDAYLIKENDMVGLKEFLEKANNWKKENCYNDQGTISFCPTYLLFSGYKRFFAGEGGPKDTILIDGEHYKINKPTEVEIEDNVPEIFWDLTCNEFTSGNFDKFTDFNSSNDDYGLEDKIRNQHYTTYFDKGYLPAYNNDIVNPAKRMDDMLKVVLPKSGHFIENEAGAFGCSNLYPNHQIFGLWFDFVQSGTGAAPIGLTGKLVSLTARMFNANFFQNLDSNIMRTNTILKWHNVYNVDIQAQLIGNKNRKYWDFIRYGKPYPSISCLLHEKATAPIHNYIGALNNHIAALNNEDYIIHYDSPLRNEGKWNSNENKIDEQYDEWCEAVDGFIGFMSGKNYPTDFIKPTIPNNPYNTTVTTFKKGEVFDNNEETLLWDVYCGDFERRRINDETKKEVPYYGPVFSDEKQYTICSTDLINAYKDSGSPFGDNWKSDIHEGYTMWENTNMKDSPAITISYLLSDTDEQQLSIFVSKDTTKNKWTTSVKIVLNENLNTYMMKVGDYYPSDINFNNLTKINPDDTGTYTIDKYGYNSYYAATQSSSSQNLHFISYCEDGITVEEKIKQEFKGKDKALIVTRYGTCFWWGASGSQWDQGVIHNLYYWNGEAAVKILAIDGFDGYWSADIEGFAPKNCFSSSNGTPSFRAYQFSPAPDNSLIVSDDKIQGDMYIKWYDANIQDTNGNPDNIGKNLNYRLNGYAKLSIENGVLRYNSPSYYRENGTVEFKEFNSPPDVLLCTDSTKIKRKFIIPAPNVSFNSSDGIFRTFSEAPPLDI